MSNETDKIPTGFNNAAEMVARHTGINTEKLEREYRVSPDKLERHAWVFKGLSAEAADTTKWLRTGKSLMRTIVLLPIGLGLVLGAKFNARAIASETAREKQLVIDELTNPEMMRAPVGITRIFKT